MKSRIDWWEVMEVFVWALGKLTRPTFNNLMTSFDEDRYRTYGARVFHQMERDKMLRREGKGKAARFTVSEEWKESTMEGRDPAKYWDAPWKGHWYLLTFDIPVTRNRDRLILWRQLSSRNIGNIQQSVWVWPHDLRPILRDILKATGIPECFAGFVAHDLFLCD